MFVAAALDAGACGAILDTPDAWPSGVRGVLIVAPDTLKALQRLAGIPGVTAVGGVGSMPLSGSGVVQQ